MTDHKRHLHYGDNLHVLREHMTSESVDLIYLDPPFNSNANYNVLFKSPAGEKSDAQLEAFEDTWHWNDSAEAASAGVYKGADGKTYPRLQILTLAELFQNRKPEIPLLDMTLMFKKAGTEQANDSAEKSPKFI
jgi:adenine specific DNA methylase Mod